jgi:hypothetical protein
MAEDQSGLQGAKVVLAHRPCLTVGNGRRCFHRRGGCRGALTVMAAAGTVRGGARFIPVQGARVAIAMKKLKNESELFKAALLEAMKYAEERGAVEFEATDSASQKLLYVYRLLVHDKLIQPIPEVQVSEAALRHKLAIWYARQLPEDHPLLK